MKIKQLNKSASATFKTLVDGLAVGESRTIDNAPGAFMAVHVSRLTEHTYSIAHYYNQNGDLVADPEMEFFVNFEGSVLPTASTACGFGAIRGLWIVDGAPARFRPGVQSDLANFANMWMKNIRDQQGIKLSKRA